MKNKVVWITGASSGIGEALAKGYSALGCNVILSARREEVLHALSEKLPNPSFVLPFDLEKRNDYALLAKKVIDKFGRIDILVNNGGISQRSLATDTSEEIERKIMEVNFFSYTSLTKAILPFMMNQGGGHVVVMSSIAGKFGFYLRTSYSAAKHALQGYFESLALELEEKNINITIVCPGKIKTEISLNALNSKGERNQQMEKEHELAMGADECAARIIEAVNSKKKEILIGGKEVKAVWLKRFFPAVFNKIIKNQKPY